MLVLKVPLDSDSYLRHLSYDTASDFWFAEIILAVKRSQAHLSPHFKRPNSQKFGKKKAFEQFL